MVKSIFIGLSLLMYIVIILIIILWLLKNWNEITTDGVVGVTIIVVILICASLATATAISKVIP